MVEVDNTPLRVFDEKVVAFLDELSGALMKSPVSRLYPDIMSFAFYIRKANIQKLRNTLFPYSGPWNPEPRTQNPELGTKNSEPRTQNSDPGPRLGRGVCFHIAPSNIPINFAFSWVFSLLAGNANIVRLPSKDFPQVTALLGIIDEVLTRNPELKTRNSFVKYPRTDNETTAAYSAAADCRMIWGGDRTIAAVRSLPTKPRCVDIAFADRYSVAMIDGEAVLAAEDAKLARLAQDFYNDTYLMDQNACSSPQLILWLNDSAAARRRFWDAVYDFASVKYVLQDAVSVDKLTTLCEEAVNNPNVGEVTRRGNLLARVEIKALNADIINHRGKAGLFFEYSVGHAELGIRNEELGIGGGYSVMGHGKGRDAGQEGQEGLTGQEGRPGSVASSNLKPQTSNLSNLSNVSNLSNFISLITEKYQTITQFGVDAGKLAESLVANNCRGVDRIVPIGKAMDIGAIWDGHDLIRELSRIVACG